MDTKFRLRRKPALQTSLIPVVTSKRDRSSTSTLTVLFSYRSNSAYYSLSTVGTRFNCVTGEGAAPAPADCQVIISFLQTNFIDIGKCPHSDNILYVSGSNIAIKIAKNHSQFLLGSQRCSPLAHVNGRGSIQSLPMGLHWDTISRVWQVSSSLVHCVIQKLM